MHIIFLACVVIVELNRSKWMMGGGGGFDGNLFWGGGWVGRVANLPVCRIFRRVLTFIHHFRCGLMGQNSFNYFSSTGTTCSRAIHSMFLHEHLWEPQWDLQLYLTISNKDACCWWVSSYLRSLPSSSCQPQSCDRSATLLHCCIWWWTLRLG